MKRNFSDVVFVWAIRIFRGGTCTKEKLSGKLLESAHAFEKEYEAGDGFGLSKLSRKSSVPSNVAFIMWTASLSKILSTDHLGNQNRPLPHRFLMQKVADQFMITFLPIERRCQAVDFLLRKF